MSHAEADAGGKGIGELPEQLPYLAGFNSDYKKDHTCQASAGGGPGGDHAGAWSATEGHERVGSDAGHIATDGRDRILFESCGMRQA